jgi:uncharacterized protein YpmS
METMMHWPWNAAILLAIGYALLVFAIWRVRINERREQWAMRLHNVLYDDQERP